MRKRLCRWGRLPSPTVLGSSLCQPDASLRGQLRRCRPIARAGCSSATIPVIAGQPITMTLAWRALNTPPRDLVRFLHVLGPDGRPVAQEDSPPCAGACPAPSWLPGEVLVDQARLTIPADLPAGTYPLAVGWYDAETFRRLPVKGGSAGRSRGSGALAAHTDGITIGRQNMDAESADDAERSISSAFSASSASSFSGYYCGVTFNRLNPADSLRGSLPPAWGGGSA